MSLQPIESPLSNSGRYKKSVTQSREELKFNKPSTTHRSIMGTNRSTSLTNTDPMAPNSQGVRFSTPSGKVKSNSMLVPNNF